MPRPTLLNPSIYGQPLLAKMAAELFEDSLFPSFVCQKGGAFCTHTNVSYISTCHIPGFCIEWQAGRGWDLEVVRTCTISDSPATVSVPVPFTETPHVARHLWDALRDTVMEAVRGQWEDVYERKTCDRWTFEDIKSERVPVSLTGFRAIRNPDSGDVSFAFLDRDGDDYPCDALALSASVDRLLDWLEAEQYEEENEDTFDVRIEDLECRTPRALGGTL